MEKDKQKKINRNNRKRGSAFEKSGADYLDMDVVPYSGSNARFGYGDVRNSVWLGEFKNITPTEDGRVTIRMEWLTKNNERAKDVGKYPFIAWMPSGKVTKYVILNTLEYFKTLPCIDHWDIHRNVHNNKNIIIFLNAMYMTDIKGGHIVELNLYDEITLYMMSIQTFKKIIDDNGVQGTRLGY